MSSSNLAKLLDKVKLSEDEEGIVDLGEEEIGNSRNFNPQVLMGRWVSRKPVNVKAMSQAFLVAWNTRKGFQLRGLGDGKSTRDKEKVLKESPWHFERQLVELVEPKRTDQLSEVNLSRCSFWVRINDLPLDRRSEKVVRKVAEKAGTVEEIDEVSLFCVHTFVRVRVSIPFQYEKLPNFCFYCGRLSHTQKACELKPKDYVGDEWPFSPLLRASPGKVGKITVGALENKSTKLSLEKGGGSRKALFGQGGSDGDYSGSDVQTSSSRLLVWNCYQTFV